MMSRKIGLAAPVQRRSVGGQHYYIDPIMGMDSELFDSIEERDAEIAQHYREPEQCKHTWEERTCVRNRYEPSMCSGVQRCTKCGLEVRYQKEWEG